MDQLEANVSTTETNGMGTPHSNGKLQGGINSAGIAKAQQDLAAFYRERGFGELPQTEAPKKDPINYDFDETADAAVNAQANGYVTDDEIAPKFVPLERRDQTGNLKARERALERKSLDTSRNIARRRKMTAQEVFATTGDTDQKMQARYLELVTLIDSLTKK